jgi:hypothetical protein
MLYRAVRQAHMKLQYEGGTASSAACSAQTRQSRMRLIIANEMHAG